LSRRVGNEESLALEQCLDSLRQSKHTFALCQRTMKSRVADLLRQLLADLCEGEGGASVSEDRRYGSRAPLACHSFFGMARSRIMRSGLRVAVLSTASRPSWASPQTSQPPSSSKRRRARLAAGLSSAMRIRAIGQFRTVTCEGLNSESRKTGNSLARAVATSTKCAPGYSLHTSGNEPQ
jgi:hypothetical protein